ncbi:MAG: Uma2 family endonuclease [Planctomycetota bacterium]
MAVLELDPPTTTEDVGKDILESGMRLTREEFHRRYEHLDGITAELINGVVFLASPVRNDVHGFPHANLMWWLNSYRVRRPHLIIGDNSSVMLSDDSEVQPDAFLMRPADDGGQAQYDTYVYGAPELVCEVAASSAHIDAHDKAEAYAKAGVREYLLWRTVDRRIDWFELKDGRFVALPVNEGVIESRVFDGLRLDREAMLAGDLAKVLATLDA